MRDSSGAQGTAWGPAAWAWQSSLIRSLRAPDPGVAREGVRFVLAGSTVALVYLGTTTALAELAKVPFQVALAIGFCAGLLVHFTLQRVFVWRHREEFALPMRHQAARYLAVAATQYVVTAASTSLLPRALGEPTELVYLATVGLIVCTNFVVFRHVVFHATQAVDERAPARPHEPQAPSAATRLRPLALARPRTRIRLPGSAVLDPTIAVLAVLLIASPVLFTRNGFASDFTNSLWLSSYQEHAIATYLHPTLFMQTEQGTFSPLFAFYAGTLYAITGALGVLLGGSTVLAFEAMTVAAIAAAYGGLFWLARQLGVRGLLAHAPALVFVTSAYYITDLYGRGDWPEFVAVSMLPLAVAATLRVVRGPWRAGPVVCLVAASMLLGGSHNITLLWGTTLAVIALVLYWLLSGRSRKLPWPRMLAAGGLIALGLGLNGWFLLPDALYGFKTMVSAQVHSWETTAHFNTASVIFDPLREVPRESGTPALYVQAPVLALAWGLLMLPLVWRGKLLRAGAVTALVTLAALLVLIMSESAFTALPNPYAQIQYPYRMQAYVALACAGLVLVGTLALTRRARSSGGAKRTDRALALGLALAVACGVALAAWQLWVPNTHIPGHPNYSVRASALTSSTTVLPKSWWWPNNLYEDDSLPIVPTKLGVTFNPALVKDDRIVGQGRFPAGAQPFATNIDGGPYLVHVGGGVRVVGRTAEGSLVLARTQDTDRVVPFEVRPQLSAPVVLGRLITATSALLLLALVAMGRRAVSVRRRRAPGRSS